MHTVRVLDPPECEETRRLLHSLRPLWIQRAPLPFYTLGAATYMDAVGGKRATYLDLAGRFNPVLAEHFGWLHEKVLLALSQTLGRSVTMAPGFALPGFHIFLAHPAFAQPLASVHIDLQYLEHPWSELGEPDLDHPVSFTLSIALPAAGSGLLVWPQGLTEARTLSNQHLSALLRSQVPSRVPYSTGSMVIHDGHLVHQMAPPPHIGPEDERITLQGHALRCGDRWYAYW